MLEKIKSLFSGTSQIDPDEAGLTPQKAAAALLVETALADGVYARVEEETILQCLKETFALDDAACEELLKDGEDLANKAVDHHRFTSTVKDGLDHETRVRLMENLWRVVMADGENDATGDSLLRRLAPLLALSDRDRIHARHAAEARQD